MTINLSTEIVALGVTLLGAVISGVYAAGKFRQSIRNQGEEIAKIDSTAEKLSDDIKSISSKLDQLIGKVSVILKDSLADSLSKSESPRQLNELGKKVLADSSVEQVLDPLFDEIVDSVRDKKPENPYQAQEYLFEVVQALKGNKGILPAIENGAYLSGHTPEEVLYVGALNMRDRVIEALGLEVGDIDKHDPTKQK